jgi:hypothetical protein
MEDGSMIKTMDMTLFFWIMGGVGGFIMLLFMGLMYFVKRLIDNLDRIEVKVTDFSTSIKLQSLTNVGLLEKIEEIWEEIKNIYSKHEHEILKNSERHDKVDKELIEVNKILVAMLNRHEHNHGETISVIGKI